MIRRAIRSLRAVYAYVRVCVHQLRELTRGGAIGDSDRPWPPADDTTMPSRSETHERSTTTPTRPVLAPLGTCPRCGSIRVWRYGSSDRSRPTALRCARCAHVFGETGSRR